MSRITLLTDFGTADGYVAAMKGAIAEIAPSVLIDDASHDIGHGDIVGGALALRRYWKLYPAGTVHVVVIDPGVGTSRRALVIESDARFIVAPDNGVATYAMLGDARVFQATHDAKVSNTFHGRDVFAPLAAKLATGVGIEELGQPINDPVRIVLPPPIATEDSVRGEIIHVDRFGNLISNVPGEDLKPGMIARVKDREIEIAATYGDAEPGGLVCLINSDGMLEVAVRDGSAALHLHAERGDTFELVTA